MVKVRGAAQRGVTLIEVLVAGALISLSLLGTIGAFVVGAQTSSLSWRRTVAMHLLARRLEQLAVADRFFLESVGDAYQYDMRFDDNGTACPMGSAACSSATYRFTSCVRRLSAPVASSSAAEVLALHVRVDWARRKTTDANCPEDSRLPGGTYVSYPLVASR